MNIPDKLKDTQLRFIKIRNRSKKAVEKGWNTTANYKWNDKELADWLNSGQNYGLVCGFGNLIAVDADTADIVTIVENKLPKTFTVSTGKNDGKHYIFRCSDWKKNTALDSKDGKNIGHIKASNGYIVGAGSVHPTGKTYNVVRNTTIAEVTADELKKIFEGYFVEHKNWETPSEHKECVYEIAKILDTSKYEEKAHGEWQGAHPVHGSSTGANFTFNTEKNTWYCFRHSTGGTTLQLLAVILEVVKCEDLHNGLSDKDYSDMLKIWKREYGG